MLAWHFVGTTLRDGAPIPPDGETIIFDGVPIPCEQGLHASARVIDALRYAPGGTLCRVRMGGVIEKESDKVCATERTILWRINADNLLCAFARSCALDVIHLWNAPDVVRDYLKTGDNKLRAAASAAASAAARDAVREAQNARLLDMISDYIAPLGYEMEPV